MATTVASRTSDVESSFRRNGIEAQLLPSQSGGFPMWLINARVSRLVPLEPLLSDEEHENAARFKSRPLRDRYVVGHTSLRILLRDFIGIPLETQIIEENEFGKPRLSMFPRLHYSMSYSGNYVVIGISEGDEIGVDVEVFRSIPDAIEVAEVHFTPKEQAEIRRAVRSDGEVSSAFLQIWVRKEAVVKAFGCGLNIPLSEVECSGGDQVMTVPLSGGQCRTGVIKLLGDPNLAWARRTT